MSISTLHMQTLEKKHPHKLYSSIPEKVSYTQGYKEIYPSMNWKEGKYFWKPWLHLWKRIASSFSIALYGYEHFSKMTPIMRSAYSSWAVSPVLSIYLIVSYEKCVLFSLTNTVGISQVNFWILWSEIVISSK